MLMSRCTWAADYVQEHLSKLITQKPEIIDGPVKAHDRGTDHSLKSPVWFVRRDHVARFIISVDHGVT